MITKRNLAIIRAYTGYPIGKFDWYNDYAQEVFGRPIRSSEYGRDKFYEELKEKSKKDYHELNKKWTQLAEKENLFNMQNLLANVHSKENEVVYVVHSEDGIKVFDDKTYAFAYYSALLGTENKDSVHIETHKINEVVV